MKPLKTACLFACTVFTMVACSDNNTSPTEYVEPAGSADYYINNQSTVDLNLVYTRMGAQAADSFKTIPADSSTKFLRDGHYGNNPSPSTSFSKIVFYKGAPDTSKPALTINPVEDDAWNIIAEKGFKDFELGFRAYELVITNEDLN